MIENTLLIIGYINGFGLPCEETKKVRIDPELSEDEKNAIAVVITEVDLGIEDYNYVLRTGLN